MFYVLPLDRFLILFVCLFVRLFFGCFLIASFFLIFFYSFCDNLPCSGMFRNVPGCSMFRVLLTPKQTSPFTCTYKILSASAYCFTCISTACTFPLERDFLKIAKINPQQEKPVFPIRKNEFPQKTKKSPIAI